MKRILTGIIAFGCVALLYAASPITRTVVNKTAQGIDFTQDIDVGSFDRFSIQSVYSDGTPAGFQVTDGNRATNQIAVSYTANMPSAYASQTLTVNTTAADQIDGTYLTINGILFTEGTEWDVGADKNTTAENIKAIIDAHGDFSATRSNAVVTVSAVEYGLTPNSWSITSSSPSAVSAGAATFSGGTDQQTININGTVLTEGTDWTAATDSSTTAKAISDAIMANSTLNAIIISTWNVDGTVYSTTTEAGYFTYYVVTSTNTLVSSNNAFAGGYAGDISIANNTIEEDSHNVTTGLPILLITDSGTAPTGLTSGTTYYGIKSTDDLFKLASSTTNASAGTAVDITAITGAGAFSVYPTTFSAGTDTGFYFTASNDGTNYSSVQSVVSSVTYSAAGNSISDAGEFDYRWLRVNFVRPDQGGMSLQMIIHGKSLD